MSAPPSAAGTAAPDYASVEVGTPLPTRVHRIRRQDLLRYAAASGDLNPIHWDEHAAAAAGLPDVIAHGMYVMGIAARAVAEWAGDPAAVLSFSTRFSRPVVVPHGPTGAELTVTGQVTAKLAVPTVRVELGVRCGADKVLARTRAVVTLAPAPDTDRGSTR